MTAGTEARQRTRSPLPSTIGREALELVLPQRRFRSWTEPAVLAVCGGGLVLALGPSSAGPVCLLVLGLLFVALQHRRPARVLVGSSAVRVEGWLDRRVRTARTTLPLSDLRIRREAGLGPDLQTAHTLVFAADGAVVEMGGLEGSAAQLKPVVALLRAAAAHSGPSS